MRRDLTRKLKVSRNTTTLGVSNLQVLKQTYKQRLVKWQPDFVKIEGNSHTSCDIMTQFTIPDNLSVPIFSCLHNHFFKKKFLRISNFSLCTLKVSISTWFAQTSDINKGFSIPENLYLHIFSSFSCFCFFDFSEHNQILAYAH